MDLHHRDAGPPDAPAVVLLHGGGSRGATWDLFAPALLEAGHRVVLPDLRGHAGSPRSHAYTLEAHSDDVVALLSGGPASHIAPARLAELAALIPRCELVTIPVGHRIHSTAPDEFRRTVLRFLGDAVRDGTAAPTFRAQGAVREEQP